MELMTVAVGGFLARKQGESHGWSYLGWQMDCVSAKHISYFGLVWA